MGMGLGSHNVAVDNNIAHLLKDLEYSIVCNGIYGKKSKKEWKYAYV